MLRCGTKVCTCSGQEKWCTHAKVGDRGMHMLRLGTGMHMLRSGKKGIHMHRLGTEVYTF